MILLLICAKVITKLLRHDIINKNNNSGENMSSSNCDDIDIESVKESSDDPLHIVTSKRLFSQAKPKEK